MPTNYHGYASVHTAGADDTRRVLRVFLDPSNYPIDFHCIAERIRKYVLWLGFTEADMQKIRDIMLKPPSVAVGGKSRGREVFCSI